VIVANTCCGIIAAVGVGAYPLQGVYKSIWAASKSQTRNSIMLARRVEGSYLANSTRTKGIDHQVVLESFDDLMM
jgi:pyruvate dehydrogenase complex dehydrogenase (E1) component